MNTPNKIYLNIHPDWTEGEDEPEVTWSEEEDPFYDNIPYISKDALLEWAKGQLPKTRTEYGFSAGYISAYEEVIKKLENL